jgi:hypothetical protein
LKVTIHAQDLEKLVRRQNQIPVGICRSIKAAASWGGMFRGEDGAVGYLFRNTGRL